MAQSDLLAQSKVQTEPQHIRLRKKMPESSFFSGVFYIVSMLLNDNGSNYTQAQHTEMHTSSGLTVLATVTMPAMQVLMIGIVSFSMSADFCMYSCTLPTLRSSNCCRLCARKQQKLHANQQKQCNLTLWMQQCVYKMPVRNTNDLKQHRIDTWAQQSIVDEGIDQWRIRLHACRKARGHHFEHLL